ncbi:MAG TPA: FeoC-like transcriptional regulator [Spirochaetota bacterium]|nr:FeoC-like transcriptional regulator [Spirochaetota bacterium]HPF05766.1 FeoC-like transcriptional regulator [Spirochaetota bacterium]HPJ42487.1 FeoC-like transcriptional regulator [Spirochaetota bacterium]HPR37420.1 FeoC-like transcriptional regulator [Spirochaetota bacterium]HRX47317.1 FeoC-like transcriptional regulator [Spirochaetota bacterium]
MLSEILNYMKKNREASVSEISLYLKMDKQMVETGLEELIRKGRVERYTIQHVSCGCCSGGCMSSACGNTEVFRYIESSQKAS